MEAERGGTGGLGTDVQPVASSSLRFILVENRETLPGRENSRERARLADSPAGLGVVRQQLQDLIEWTGCQDLLPLQVAAWPRVGTGFPAFEVRLRDIQKFGVLSNFRRDGFGQSQATGVDPLVGPRSESSRARRRE